MTHFKLRCHELALGGQKRGMVNYLSQSKREENQGPPPQGKVLGSLRIFLEELLRSVPRALPSAGPNLPISPKAKLHFGIQAVREESAAEGKRPEVRKAACLFRTL